MSDKNLNMKNINEIHDHINLDQFNVAGVTRLFEVEPQTGIKSRNRHVFQLQQN
jgi:hypothetical protein